MNQTSTVEHTKTTMVTVSICRLTPSPCKVSHAVTSSCPACIPSRVITTIHHQLPPVVLQNTITTCPVCRPASTVTTTIYQQSPVVLSNTAGIGILAISAVLICLPIIAIVIVTYCWVRARRTLKKKRTDPEMKFVYLAQDR